MGLAGKRSGRSMEGCLVTVGLEVHPSASPNDGEREKGGAVFRGVPWGAERCGKVTWWVPTCAKPSRDGENW